MALDPQVQEVIKLVIKSGRPAYNTLSPKDARQLFRETRPASTPTPPEIGAVKNVSAEGPGGPIPLRVYRPAGVASATALPALVYYHGGGWVIGDLDTHDVQCRQTAAEAGMWQAFRNGSVYDLSSGDAVAQSTAMSINEPIRLKALISGLLGRKSRSKVKGGLKVKGYFTAAQSPKPRTSLRRYRPCSSACTSITHCVGLTDASRFAQWPLLVHEWRSGLCGPRAPVCRFPVERGRLGPGGSVVRSCTGLALPVSVPALRS